ncbi:sterol desaturase family protein [Thermoactinomyces sp. CICC 10521]|uniref:sterol desaturase family protein n=1 Tax=Thermoactinomyces sp. CICC 10521 TaxID=2767426 RepID=UPI0018DB0507|nr:sterol desaturase family protein [Thermoactinomyces sp. CICC 10521]MBH8607230.1 sterol desaturase family protein [Thermoactinomyces sp. CICC 10521]
MRRYLFEFFFFSDIFVMSLVCVCGLGLTLAWANSLVTVAVFLGGVALYAIAEYGTHRFLFHLPPPKHPFLLKLLKRLHYDHHEDPDKLELLFLPLWYSVPQFVLVGSIVYLVTGKIAITTTFLSGAVLYHLYYEWKHYIAHRPIKPLTPWGKKLKKYHLLHHFKNEHYWFGVTNPAMDHLFRTFPDESGVEMSRTARKLADKK